MPAKAEDKAGERMENKVTTIAFDFSTAKTDVKEVTQALGGLQKTLKGLKSSLLYALCWTAFSSYVADAVTASGNLDKELLVLRLNLGKLKHTFADAIAPVAAVFVPMINQAVRAATKLVSTIGQVIGALFRGSTAEKTLQENAEYAAKAQERLSTSSGEVSRALADFDEIDTLAASSGSTGTTSQVLPDTVEDSLSPEVERIVSGIQKLLQPLQQLDFSGAVEAFGKLKTALEPIKKELFEALHWAWENLLVPLAKWTVEEFLPEFLETLTAALQLLSDVIVVLKPLASWLWENFLQPLARWAGEAIVEGLGNLTQKLTDMSIWVTNNQGKIQSLVTMLDDLKTSWQDTKAQWSDGTWLQEGFLGPAVEGCKTGINKVIGFINSMVGAVVSGINALIAALNKLQFSVPSWVPGLGGEQFGFHLKPVTAPKIPLLAQGAVLPANRPFLAVVGDQKNGTNVEAPLSTIRQAVAEALAQQGGQAVSIRFTGDLAQLGRVLKPVVERETKRTGVSLAKGVY